MATPKNPKHRELPLSLKIRITDVHKQTKTTTVKQYHDIFLTVLYQSRFNIFNYELMNEVCIVFSLCLYIKERKSMCNFH